MMDLTSWRLTWVVMGMLVLVLALPVAYLLLRDDPSDMGLLPDGDQEPSDMDPQGKPESTEGGRRVSVLKRQEGAPVLLG